MDDGAAQLAGLSAGDVVIAIDGIRLQGKEFSKYLAQYKPGDNVQFHAFRRDELMMFTVALQEAPRDTCELRLIDNADQAMVKNRDQWLYGK